MATVLVLYDFSHGHVEEFAHKIAASAREAVASADVKHVLELRSLKAAKAVNYNLIRPLQPRALTTSPSTTRSSRVQARLSTGCRATWQASSTRRWPMGQRGAIHGKVGGAFVVGDAARRQETTLFTIITKLLNFSMTEYSPAR